jgi:cytochrome c biogenesis protein CcmG/thiol:disulfide interchange protein DsbE
MNAATKHHRNLRIDAKRQQTQKKRQKRILMAFGIAVSVLIGGILLLGTDTEGARVPDFTADTLTGESVHLSDYRGQVIMLNFWATWCPPCRAEMPTIEAAYEQYHDQGFAVFAINNAEHPAQIQPFADALSLRFSIVLDTEARLQRTFAISGYPTSLFISPNGDLYAKHSGMLTPQQLDSYIETGLAMLQQNPEA